MLAIGIDPGTAITGYGVVRRNRDASIQLVDYGVIRTPADQPMPERLMDLSRRLEALIELHRPQSGAVEKLFFQRNVSTALSVGQARGIALLCLAKGGVSVSEYTPQEVKLAVAGYGKAGKQQVQRMVQQLLGMSELPQPDDAADALAVAICHLHSGRLQRLAEDQP